MTDYTDGPITGPGVGGERNFIRTERRVHNARILFVPKRVYQRIRQRSRLCRGDSVDSYHYHYGCYVAQFQTFQEVGELCLKEKLRGEAS